MQSAHVSSGAPSSARRRGRATRRGCIQSAPCVAASCFNSDSGSARLGGAGAALPSAASEVASPRQPGCDTGRGPSPARNSSHPRRHPYCTGTRPPRRLHLAAYGIARQAHLLATASRAAARPALMQGPARGCHRAARPLHARRLRARTAARPALMQWPAANGDARPLNACAPPRTLAPHGRRLRPFVRRRARPARPCQCFRFSGKFGDRAATRRPELTLIIFEYINIGNMKTTPEGGFDKRKWAARKRASATHWR